MAEGGGDNHIMSYNHGSDDYSDLICAPCNDDGNHQVAAKFCSQCSEYLCTVCARYHRRLPGTENHQLSDVNGGNPDSKKRLPSSKGKAPERLTDKCPSHPDRDIEFYCKSHDMVYCALCIANDHRSCVGVLKVTDNSLIVKEETDCDPNVLLHKVEDTIQMLNETTNEVKDNANNIDSQQTEILEDIDVSEAQLIEQIASLKQKAKDKLSELRENLRAELADEIDHIDAMITQLQLQRSRVDKVNYMNDVQKLVFTKLLKNTIKSAEQLQTKLRQSGNKHLQFDTSVDLLGALNMPRWITNISDVRPDKSNTTVQSVQEIVLNRKSDSLIGFIIDICQLANGTVLVADNRNGTLNRLDNDYNVCEKFKLDSCPISICQTREDNVAVKLNNDKIQIVRVTDRMASIKTFSITNSQLHFGMVYENDKLWVLEGRYLRTYDEFGNLLKSCDMNQRFANKQKRHMKINLKKDMLLVADGEDGVVCVGLDGVILRTINDYRLQGAWGVCISQNGTLLVAGRQSKNIVMFRESGECLGELQLPQNKQLESPYSIVYDDLNKRLLITANQNKLYVIKF